MTIAPKKFQRRIEDFTCEQCGSAVVGNGYRNHCPRCLYSKHVDMNPGDRAASCGGLMKCADIELRSGVYILTHVCERCGHRKKNKLQKDDDIDAVIAFFR